MQIRVLTVFIAAALAAFISAESRAQSPPVLEKAAIEEIVRDYLLRNPEVIEKALRNLQEKRRSDKMAQAEAAIRENVKALNSHPLSPVSGNSGSDVIVVEFFDYRCGYCKRVLPTMKALLETDAKVRIVWKEFPILGPVSLFAARAAMAADRQGGYVPFHLALMKEPKLTEDKVLELAAATGLDTKRLRKDMEDPAIGAYLDETRALARKIGVSGTPAFVVGGKLVSGAVDMARMKKFVAAARAAGNR